MQLSAELAAELSAELAAELAAEVAPASGVVVPQQASLLRSNYPLRKIRVMFVLILCVCAVIRKCHQYSPQSLKNR